MEDVTGKPRPMRDIKAAFDCLRSEIVRNPMALSNDGQPLVMHYLVICDVIRELAKFRGESL